MSDKIAKRFRVQGRVQGVWFRASTQSEAERLGITGHALNLPDGAVEVLACGHRSALDELAAWLSAGPPLARVDSVAAEVCDLSQFADEVAAPDRFSRG